MRALKVAVIVMAVLLVAGFSLVIGELIRRHGARPLASPGASQVVSPGANPAASAFGTIEVALPAGCTLADSTVSEGRLVLRLGSGGACGLIIVLDLATGRELGRFKLTPGP
jgi:hypothetical protein